MRAPFLSTTMLLASLLPAWSGSLASGAAPPPPPIRGVSAEQPAPEAGDGLRVASLPDWHEPLSSGAAQYVPLLLTLLPVAASAWRFREVGASEDVQFGQLSEAERRGVKAMAVWQRFLYSPANQWRWVNWYYVCRKSKGYTELLHLRLRTEIKRACIQELMRNGAVLPLEYVRQLPEGQDKDAAVAARQQHGLPVDPESAAGDETGPASPDEGNSRREMRSMADDLGRVNGRQLQAEVQKRLRDWIGFGVTSGRAAGGSVAAAGTPSSAVPRWTPRRGAVGLH